MILTIYILFQIIAIVALIIAMTTEIPLTASISVVTSAILTVGAWVITIGGEYVWDATINAYYWKEIVVSTPYLAMFNIMLFGLSLVYFFYDSFTTIQKESGKLPNLNNGKEF